MLVIRNIIDMNIECDSALMSSSLASSWSPFNGRTRLCDFSASHHYYV